MKKWIALNCACGVMASSIPMMVFLKHQAYPLLTWEALMLFSVMAIIGIGIGCTVSFLVPRRFIKYPMGIACILALNLLFTALAPSGKPVTHEGELGTLDSDLPFILHIVLDEQIGVEGIPVEFDEDWSIYEEVRDLYADNGFQLYGNAYSRWDDTIESLRNMLSSENVGWFGRLHDWGFKITTITSDYIPLAGDQTITYRLGGAIKTLTKVIIPDVDKAKLIMGLFLKSHGLKDHATPLTHFAAAEMIFELEDQIMKAQRGQAIFAHIILPHSPYAFDRNCEMDRDISTWLPNDAYETAPWRNNEYTRAERYPRYLNQMICVQRRMGVIFELVKQRGLWEEAIIIIHGDHGSRIDTRMEVRGGQPIMDDNDMIDAFSTLYAVKRPWVVGGYFDSQLPIDHLFKRVFLEGKPVHDQELEDNPFVWVDGQKRPMPKKEKK